MALDLPSYLMGKSRGGGGGTSDYSQLSNKPSINGVTLSGNKTGADLGLLSGDYDIRTIIVRNTPTAEDLTEASKLINDLYAIYQSNEAITDKLLVNVVTIPTNEYNGNMFITKFPTKYLINDKRTAYEFRAQPSLYPLTASSSYITTINTFKITGTWSNNVFTATGLQVVMEGAYSGSVLTTGNYTAFTPTAGSYQPATAKYVEDVANPVVTTSSASTYTIASLVGNQTYKLGEITSLTITATTTFDKESVIYFESGSTATSISIPDSITNLGDVPTLTTASNVNTGTCDANKKYIIAILNNIAVWKKY